MNSDFHIGISFQEDFPNELIEEYTSSISAPELKIRAESREIGVYASIEWALPTLVIVYLSKPYFEAFLQEAGKDHYQLLKKGTLELFNHLYGSKPEKRDKKRSRIFSAMVQLQDGRSLKFVFPEGVSIEQYKKSLEVMHDLLLKHYVDHPNDQITEMASQLSTPTRSLYIEYKAEKENWVLIDPLVEAQKARKAQNEHNK